MISFLLEDVVGRVGLKTLSALRRESILLPSGLAGGMVPCLFMVERSVCRLHKPENARRLSLEEPVEDYAFLGVGHDMWYCSGRFRWVKLAGY